MLLVGVLAIALRLVSLQEFVPGALLSVVVGFPPPAKESLDQHCWLGADFEIDSHSYP